MESIFQWHDDGSIATFPDAKNNLHGGRSSVRVSAMLGLS